MALDPSFAFTRVAPFYVRHVELFVSWGWFYLFTRWSRGYCGHSMLASRGWWLWRAPSHWNTRRYRHKRCVWALPLLWAQRAPWNFGRPKRNAYSVASSNISVSVRLSNAHCTPISSASHAPRVALCSRRNVVLGESSRDDFLGALAVDDAARALTNPVTTDEGQCYVKSVARVIGPWLVQHRWTDEPAIWSRHLSFPQRYIGPLTAPSVRRTWHLLNEPRYLGARGGQSSTGLY